MLARALKAFYERGRTEWLDEYSDLCLRRVWKAQRFSWWMTSTLHRSPDESAFDHQRQIADLDYLTSSRAAMTSLAEQYVGLPDGSVVRVGGSGDREVTFSRERCLFL